MNVLCDIRDFLLKHRYPLNYRLPSTLPVASLHGFLFQFLRGKISTLFLFLSCSLSQYSDENMMDPGNLAICFGPTLMPTPDLLDQVSCQAHVNEIIKTIIIHHEAIFPDTKELEGPVYEKCMSSTEYW